MVDKFKQIIAALESKYQKKLSLFAIMKMDDFADKWSIFLAADWIDDSNRSEVFQNLVSIMKSLLSEEENGLIARVGIFPISDYVVQLFLKFKEETKIDNQKVNGFFIYEAYILRSTNLIPIPQDKFSISNPIIPGNSSGIVNLTPGVEPLSNTTQSSESSKK